MEGQPGDNFEELCSSMAQNDGSIQGLLRYTPTKQPGTRIIFCSKCGACFWERGSAHLRKIRSGMFPHRELLHWTSCVARRPALQEASSVVAQLVSCRTGLG